MILFHFINLLTGLSVMWGSMCALNNMCCKSPLILRAAHICIAVGAAGVLMAPLYLHRTATVAELLLLYGAAIMTLRPAFRRAVRYLREFI